MGWDSGVVAVIRRVPPFVVWAMLSTAWVAFLRLFEPGAEALEYLQIPTYLGVTLIAARFVPRKHLGWLPPLIGLLVTLPLVLGWKALS